MENMVNLFKGNCFVENIPLTDNISFKGFWMGHWFIKMGASTIEVSKNITCGRNHYF